MNTDLVQSTVLPAHWRPNYDRRPTVAVPDEDGACASGWDAIAADLARRLDAALPERLGEGSVLCVDCYDGVYEAEVAQELQARLAFDRVVWTRDLLRPPAALEAMLVPYTGGDDPVFGFRRALPLLNWFDAEALAAARAAARRGEQTLVVGVGAALVHPGSVQVLADMPRWEIQARQRAGTAGNVGAQNEGERANLLYKRAYFAEWRTLDAHKVPLLASADALLDTTSAPVLVDGEALRRGLAHTVTRPFRVVPFFDPGPWGGQWMREVLGLHDYRADDPPNYAWCFDCVPEENALRLGFGDATVEIPSLDLIFCHAADLLGDPVQARFGDEFPIRFDLLDTMGGGNLSFQVHPTTEYVQQHFGMAYTQDESYYLLDAAPDGTCYIGLAPDTDPAAFRRALEAAQAGGAPFDAEAFAHVVAARPHDHILIPAGTVHCSGRNTLVLEISATPYIFTFKLWDWGRLGLDGRPRPINIERGMEVVDWERDAAVAERELVNAVEPVAEGPGWREERTGLHRREFIETRRHWFTVPVAHDTGGARAGGVHVLNLVQGAEALVESPEGAFEPFAVHYAETWIVPAAVGRYTVRPVGEGEHATIRASVRTSP